MMDFDELLAGNHSLSINQINHSSESVLFAGNHISIVASLDRRSIISINISTICQKETLGERQIRSHSVSGRES
jgi:hypothetical protein